MADNDLKQDSPLPPCTLHQNTFSYERKGKTFDDLSQIGRLLRMKVAFKVIFHVLCTIADIVPCPQPVELFFLRLAKTSTEP